MDDGVLQRFGYDDNSVIDRKVEDKIVTLR